MRVFVGFGYNDRDRWIEAQVFPILEAMAFTVHDGKDLYGELLQPEIQRLITQSDAAIGFLTLREGQGDADFNSHIWVRDEMVYALGLKKPVILIREQGVRVPPGLFGERQYITLESNDRLACVVQLIRALGKRNIRRLKLDPQRGKLSKDLWNWWTQKRGLLIQYRTRDGQGHESTFKEGRLELVEQGFFLNVADVPAQAYVEVEGLLNGEPKFSSGWVSANAVQVKIS
jgi:hypothetical protein